jgi:hypothetical protein
MYARFLEEAGRGESALAQAAAERWTALAQTAREASESDEPEPGRWRELGSRAEAVLGAEEGLWTSLAP